MSLKKWSQEGMCKTYQQASPTDCYSNGKNPSQSPRDVGLQSGCTESTPTVPWCLAQHRSSSRAQVCRGPCRLYTKLLDWSAIGFCKMRWTSSKEIVGFGALQWLFKSTTVLQIFSIDESDRRIDRRIAATERARQRRLTQGRTTGIR